MWTPMVHRRGGSGCALLPALLAVLLLSGTSRASILGYTYGGRSDSTVSSPEEAVMQFKARAITKLRLYDADRSMLRALANSAIEVMVGIQNAEIGSLAEDLGNAGMWVNINILPFVGKTNITTIAVGNEVLTEANLLSLNLVQAMQNVYQALVETKLDSQVKVSTPHSMSVLRSYYPPSWGYFSHEVMPAILQFLSQTQSPFLLNLYPYLEYKSFTKELGLDYHLLNPSEGFVDQNSGLLYENAFDATLDAVFSAMASLDYSDLSIVISETSWPSKENSGSKGASPVGAELYHSNLVNLIHSRKGTPRKPDTQIQVYTKQLSYANLQPSLMAKEQEIALDFHQLPAKHRRLGDGTGFIWCISKSNADVYELQDALNWTCSKNRGGINCDPIQVGGVCFLPNTIQAHSAWAFNEYYYAQGGAADACNFSGTAMTTTNDPGTMYCLYPGTSSAVASAAYMHGVVAAQSLLAFLFTYLLIHIVL